MSNALTSLNGISLAKLKVRKSHNLTVCPALGSCDMSPISNADLTNLLVVFE